MAPKFKFKTKDEIPADHYRVRAGRTLTALLAIVALTAVLAVGLTLRAIASPPAGA